MTYSLTDDDNGRVLQLQVGDQLQLTLRESRMSGYRWSLLESGEPSLEHAETGTQSNPGIIGQPNLRGWQFTAKQAGLARVVLRQARSWEPPSSGSEFSLSAKISA